MKLVLIITLFFNFLFSSEIINTTYYNYPNDKKVVVLFSLDEPFKGKIKKINEHSYLINGIHTKLVETKKFKSVINSLLISSDDDNSVKIEIYSKNRFKVNAAVTKIGYGLKFSIISLKPTTTNNTQIVELPASTGPNLLSYFAVIFILIILIIILFIIKNKGIKMPMQMQKNGNVNVVFKKYIDTKNFITKIKVDDKEYLILMSENGNILLDSSDKIPEIQESQSFNELLENQKMESLKYKASRLNEEV